MWSILGSIDEVTWENLVAILQWLINH